MHFPYDPAIPLLDISRREMKTCPQTHLFKMFTEVLFIRAKKMETISSTEEWITEYAIPIQ